MPRSSGFTKSNLSRIFSVFLIVCLLFAYDAGAFALFFNFSKNLSTNLSKSFAKSVGQDFHIKLANSAATFKSNFSQSHSPDDTITHFTPHKRQDVSRKTSTENTERQTNANSPPNSLEQFINRFIDPTEAALAAGLVATYRDSGHGTPASS